MRHARLAPLLQRIIGDYLNQGGIVSSDLLLTVTLVEVTPNLRSARVYLSVLPRTGATVDKQATLTAIAAERARIRLHLGKKIGQQVRGIPALYFYLDDTASEAIRLATLLNPR